MFEDNLLTINEVQYGIISTYTDLNLKVLGMQQLGVSTVTEYSEDCTLVFCEVTDSPDVIFSKLREMFFQIAANGDKFSVVGYNSLLSLAKDFKCYNYKRLRDNAFEHIHDTKGNVKHYIYDELMEEIDQETEIAFDSDTIYGYYTSRCLSRGLDPANGEEDNEIYIPMYKIYITNTNTGEYETETEETYTLYSTKEQCWEMIESLAKKRYKHLTKDYTLDSYAILDVDVQPNNLTFIIREDKDGFVLPYLIYEGRLY